MVMENKTDLLRGLLVFDKCVSSALVPGLGNQVDDNIPKTLALATASVRL
jgi:hypothetical protein